MTIEFLGDLTDRDFLYTRWSTVQFAAAIERAVGHLRARGLASGDAVGLCFMTNTVEELILRRAVWSLGATVVTVNGAHDDADRICFKLKNAGCLACLVHPDFPSEKLAGVSEVLGALGLLSTDSILPATSDDPVARRESLASLQWYSGGNQGPRESISGDVIIHTSGTTGVPKGVRLPERAYAANAEIFENFLQVQPQDDVCVVVCNPMHHANSTAMTDWILRRSTGRLVLFERYSRHYFPLVASLAHRLGGKIIAPIVSRHIDFARGMLESWPDAEKVELLEGLSKPVFLMGSAPVGPKTAEIVRAMTGRLPTVRFGSTELCLQALGIPLGLPADRVMEAFCKGAEHTWKGTSATGYYIGRPHHPWTEAKIVKSVESGDSDFMVEAQEGEPGRLVIKSRAVMDGYLGAPSLTENVLDGEWYLGLGDVAFALASSQSGIMDFYWMSRANGLMIRGGSNYACEQVEQELTQFMCQQFGLASDAFDLAVVGIKLMSEHEDSCCVTVDLAETVPTALRDRIEEEFVGLARQHVSKGAKPDVLRLGSVPRNFKGAIERKKMVSYFRGHD